VGIEDLAPYSERSTDDSQCGGVGRLAGGSSVLYACTGALSEVTAPYASTTASDVTAMPNAWDSGRHTRNSVASPCRFMRRNQSYHVEYRCTKGLDATSIALSEPSMSPTASISSLVAARADD